MTRDSTVNYFQRYNLNFVPVGNPRMAGIIASLYGRLENLENVAEMSINRGRRLSKAFFDGITGFYGIFSFL